MRKLVLILSTIFFVAIYLGIALADPGDSCGPGKVYDCANNCVDQAEALSWIGDGYCDDGTWGMDLRCSKFNNDGGDCGGGGNPGDSCGTGKVLDCALNCVDQATAQSWIGDGYCDDENSPYGYVLTCPEFNNDGGDCGGGGNPGDSCGTGKILDCALNCVDQATAQSYIGDTYCDEGQWGYYLNCPEFNNDGGDCGGGGNPGDSCGTGKILDCALNCVDQATAQSYIGDGWCDDGSYGYTLTCPEFNNDGGDCGGGGDIVGTWTLYYDYGCVGWPNYKKVELWINADGTWSNSGGFSGTWTLVGDQVTFYVSQSGEVYTGTVTENNMEGTMAPATGCWWAYSDDHGDNCSNATIFESPGTISGRLDHETDIDYFRLVGMQFPGPGPWRVYSSGNNNTVGRLYDTNCNHLSGRWWDDNSGCGKNFSISFEGHSSLIVSVNNSTFQGGDIWDYTLFVEYLGYDSNNSPCSSSPWLSIGSTTNGAINYNGDTDWYRVYVLTPRALTIYTTGNTDTMGFLFRDCPSTILLDSNDDSGSDCNFKISHAVTTGTYYILVRHHSSDYGTGRYTLHVE